MTITLKIIIFRLFLNISVKKLDMQDFEEKYKTYFILYKYLFSEKVNKISNRMYRENISCYYSSLLNKERSSGL